MIACQPCLSDVTLTRVESSREVRRHLRVLSEPEKLVSSSLGLSKAAYAQSKDAYTQPFVDSSYAPFHRSRLQRFHRHYYFTVTLIGAVVQVKEFTAPIN